MSGENVLMRDCPDYTRRADISNLFKTTGAVTKATSYTLVEADSGKLFNDTGAAGAVTLTLPDTLPIGWWCMVLHLANQSIVLAGSSATLNGAATLTADNTQDPIAFAIIIKTTATNFAVVLSGTWT